MRDLINLIERASFMETVKLKRKGEGRFSVLLDGQPIGRCAVSPESDTTAHLSIFLDDGFTGKGYGGQVHDQIEKYLAKQGRRLIPDSVLSPAAYRLWMKRNPEAVADYEERNGRYVRAISEVNVIDDFDDELNASRKLSRWEDEVPQTKPVGSIGGLKLRAFHSEMHGATMYFLMDGKKPVGKATVADTPEGYLRVKHIWFDPAYRGKSYGLGFYEFLLAKGARIVSDYDQTRHSQAIWQRLAQKYAVRPVYADGSLGDPTRDLSEFYNNSHTLLLASKT